MENEKIIEGVLQEFAGLARHPRKSGHEKEVSDYIAARLRQLGASVVQDEVNNIIADVPATKGYEDVPLTIIQGHMDMVCVAKPGRAYDPLKDPITIKRDGKTLSADGTSLGADDGMAIAISMFLIQQDFAHGPLRLIFTVDEEVGMTGATHLDSQYVQDAHYVINCDSESVDVICVASAGSVHTYFSRPVSWQEAEGTAALKITASGFIGGHSGETINQGKSNAIKALALVLQRLHQAGISYTLASYDGGDAANAIPSLAQAVIVLSDADADKACQLTAEGEAVHKAVYGAVETTLSLKAEKTDVPEKTISEADSRAVVQILNLLHFGVFAMNQHLPKLPDLSSNIGTIHIGADSVDIQYFPRSSSDARLQEMLLSLPVFAEVTGFTFKASAPAPAWSENTHSVLTPAMTAVYEKELGRTPRIEAMHGGLETGYFFAMNPDLDIVSVGPTTFAIHSADESVDLKTVAEVTRVIAGTLTALKK